MGESEDKLPASLDELGALQDNEVLGRYAYWASLRSRPTIDMAIPFWRSEWDYRRQAKATRTMTTLTRWIMAMTVVMTISTLVNVILFAM